METIKITKAHIPAIVTQGIIPYPRTRIVLILKESKEHRVLDHSLQEKQDLLLVIPKKTLGLSVNAQGDSTQELFSIGVTAEVVKTTKAVGGAIQVILESKRRVKIVDLIESDGFLKATTEPLQTAYDLDEKTEEVLLSNLKDSGKEFAKLMTGWNRDVIDKAVDDINDLEGIVYLAASHLQLDKSSARELLETKSLKRSALLVLEHLVKQKESLKLQKEIGQKVSNKINRQQREAILRSQMETIKKELGQLDGTSNSAEGHQTYKERIEASAMPEEIQKVAFEEAAKLEDTQEKSPDYGVIKNYIETLLSLPWESDAAKIDIAFAKAQLESEHYGLDDVKKRIIQHLAVMKLKSDRQGSVLLLVGPPGVGKTSMAKSIAASLGRGFVRASLGGVRDEAEIRGHRRTYIGAMPGKIIQALKKQEHRNPIFLLDEIDKLATGVHGDPSAALLEVLDRKQNDTFADHFLDVPYDLSDVFFIATANSLDTIPRPLLDRMEVIRVSSYTEAEKLHIAKEHLFPNQLKEHGIDQAQLSISQDALVSVVNGFTKEAGVRELERKLAEICRGSVEGIIEDPSKSRMVNREDVLDILGPEVFQSDVINHTAPPGVATGLAWTPVGGDILFIEAKKMPGKGRLILTGQLGDVMRESAQISLTQVRTQLTRPDQPIIDFDKIDIHVHVPQGSIPKDGPSAGVTMLTTLASLFTERPVDPELAMTGEITLRGAVTAVGGIKEKLLAAHRAGVKRVLIPKGNEKDLAKLPKEVKSELKVHLVENVSEVIWHALAMDKWDDTPKLVSRHGETTPSSSLETLRE